MTMIIACVYEDTPGEYYIFQYVVSVAATALQKYHYYCNITRDTACLFDPAAREHPREGRSGAPLRYDFMLSRVTVVTPPPSGCVLLLAMTLTGRVNCVSISIFWCSEYYVYTILIYTQSCLSDCSAL